MLKLRDAEQFLNSPFTLFLFQVEIQSCCIFLPNDSLPSPSTIVSSDIPGTVRSWYHGQTSMPGTLVVCLPQIKIMSTGHKYMEPIQEIPFVVPRPIVEEGKVHYLYNAEEKKTVQITIPHLDNVWLQAEIAWQDFKAT